MGKKAGVQMEVVSGVVGWRVGGVVALEEREVVVEVKWVVKGSGMVGKAVGEKVVLEGEDRGVKGREVVRDVGEMGLETVVVMVMAVVVGDAGKAAVDLEGRGCFGDYDSRKLA